MRRLPRRQSNASELMAPEQLLAQRAPFTDPAELFKGVTIRPAETRTREQVADEGMKSPENLFGEQRLALPGAPLISPQELDLLPGQPLPEIVLEPLPDPLPDPQEASAGAAEAESAAGPEA